MAKHKCPEFENHERWLVSYADMLTLLFAVFVTLYALKEEGGAETKILKAAGSIQESFNTPLENIPLDRKVGPAELGFGIFDHFRGNQVRPPLIEKYPSEQHQIQVIDNEMKQFEMKLEERMYGPNNFREKKDKTGEERIVSVERTEKGFKVKLLARHYFKPGATQVRKGAQSELNKLVSLVKELGRNVTIEGHTDSTLHKGKYSNWELSTLRATSVLRYMYQKHNFPQTRLSAVGYADLKPLAHNGTEVGRSLNRRVEIHIHYD